MPQSQAATGPPVQEKKRNIDFQNKIDFQNGRHGGHLVLLIETILTILALQDTPMLSTKFQVSWPFGSEEEAS